MGDAQAAGAEARCAKSPQERLIVSMRVSTEPFFLIISVIDHGCQKNSQDKEGNREGSGDPVRCARYRRLFFGNYVLPSTNPLTSWGTVLFLLQQNIIIGNKLRLQPCIKIPKTQTSRTCHSGTSS